MWGGGERRDVTGRKRTQQDGRPGPKHRQGTYLLVLSPLQILKSDVEIQVLRVLKLL